MLPAAALGLFGHIPITAGSDDYPQKQAHEQGPDWDFGVGLATAHLAHHPVKGEDLDKIG
jgi:hypothetical protein